MTPPARTVYAVKKAAPGAPPPASLGAIPKKTRVGQPHNYSHFSPVSLNRLSSGRAVDLDSLNPAPGYGSGSGISSEIY